MLMSVKPQNYSKKNWKKFEFESIEKNGNKQKPKTKNIKNPKEWSAEETEGTYEITKI